MLNRAIKRHASRFPPEFVFVLGPQSLFGNYEEACGEGFWPWPRRRVPSIPAAGCKERANAGHGQKTRRPEGFRAKGRLASLLPGGRAQRPLAGMLAHRASPSGLLLENRPLRILKPALSNRRQKALRNRASQSWTKSCPTPIIWPQNHDGKI